jgi:hypothetical protein
MDTYATAAAQGFDLLADQYKTSDIFAGNFWFGGNAFHTCLDYMLRAKTTDTKSVLTTAWRIYEAAQSNKGWWRDDYGWWGNAFLLALNNRGRLGYGDPVYNSLFNSMTSATQNCWDLMTKNWSQTAFGGPKDNAHGSASIIGGVFNVAETLDEPPMQGRNCVTNEGYWLLSLGLAQRMPEKPQYSQAAKSMQAWFQRWLALPAQQPGVLNDKGLVLERPTGNATDSTWYWSGDQGLFASALYRSGANRSKAIEIARRARSNMTDGQGIIHENLEFEQHGQLQGFVADYATGKGIFMRGLVDLGTAASNPFAGFIKQNASAVWANRLDTKTNQFGFNWDRAAGYEPVRLSVSGKTQGLCDLIMQAAGQDALNAAMAISPSDPI